VRLINVDSINLTDIPKLKVSASHPNQWIKEYDDHQSVLHKLGINTKWIEDLGVEITLSTYEFDVLGLNIKGLSTIRFLQLSGNPCDDDKIVNYIFEDDSMVFYEETSPTLRSYFSYINSSGYQVRLSPEVYTIICKFFNPYIWKLSVRGKYACNSYK